MRMGKPVILLLLALSSCIYAARDLRDVPAVPDAVKVPEGYKLRLKLFGEGHQYYRYNGSNWVQFSAKASLYDGEGKKVGHHFYLHRPDSLGGQPSWKTQTSKGVPYSVITAKALVKITPDPRNIPWILLKTTSAQGDTGYFGDVAYVQRYNTTQGVAPASASGAKVGRVRRTWLRWLSRRYITTNFYTSSRELAQKIHLAALLSKAAGEEGAAHILTRLQKATTKFDPVLETNEEGSGERSRVASIVTSRL